LKFYILKSIETLEYKTRTSILKHYPNPEIAYVSSYDEFLKNKIPNSYYITSHVAVTNKFKNYINHAKKVLYKGEIIFDKISECVEDDNSIIEDKNIINNIDDKVYPNDQTQIVFNYNTMDTKLNILVNEEKIKNFKPYSMNIDIIRNCLYDCTFCTSKVKQFKNTKVMDFEKFKRIVDLITAHGIYYLEFTPNRGDFLNVPNFRKYTDYLENHELVKEYHFFTSFSFKLNNHNELIEFFKTSTKARIIASYYGIFGKDDFIKRTNTNESMYNDNRESFNLLLNNFNLKNFKVIVRPDTEMTQLEVLIKNKHIRDFYFKYKVPFIILPDILNVFDNYIKNDEYIDTICTDYFVYSSIDIDGNLIYCATRLDNENNIVQTYDDMCKNGLKTTGLYNNKTMNLKCQGCKNYEPVDYELQDALNDNKIIEYNLTNDSAHFTNNNYILKDN